MKRLLSLILCLGLMLSLAALPALADAEPSAEPAEEAAELPPEAPAEEAAEAPAGDGWGVAANVFYYNVNPGSVKSPELIAFEYIEPGAHPQNVPTWDDMVWTWYLDPDLTDGPVDPAAFTVEELGDELSFYGYIDSVCILLHMPAGSEVDVFGGSYVNRGATFPADSWGELPDGYWAAAWADADGNIIDTANTPIWEDTDLYAVAGDFRVTYLVGTQHIGGEGFLAPGGALRHIPTRYLKVDFSSGWPEDEWLDIIGWTDENGNPVDPAAITVTEDRTFYAVLEGEDFPDPKPEGHELPGPAPAVAIAEDGKTATVTGDASGLYARVALILDNSGVSGLYVTQAMINEGGVIVIPQLLVPGLTVTGVSIALVRSLDDIISPKPSVVVSSFKMFG